MSLKDTVELLLDELEIPDSRFYYLHVSLNGLGLQIKDYALLVACLKRRFSPESTIVVPSFPFGNNREYGEVLSRERLHYDVDNTPCRVNLFGEMFRRSPGIVRTWNPILPVCCLGPDARSLCDTCHLDSMPFAKNSIFGRLAAASACVIGLGVDTNTNSFAHMADDVFAARFPYDLYTRKPLHCEIRQRGQRVHAGDYYAVTVDLRRRIKPALLQPHLVGRSFFRELVSPVQAYRLEIAPYIEFMTASAQESFDQGCLPLWHMQR